jgi:hypothetical protein
MRIGRACFAEETGISLNPCVVQVSALVVAEEPKDDWWPVRQAADLRCGRE